MELESPFLLSGFSMKLYHPYKVGYMMFHCFYSWKEISIGITSLNLERLSHKTAGSVDFFGGGKEGEINYW
jgi:hypothetical protein